VRGSVGGLSNMMNQYYVTHTHTHTQRDGREGGEASTRTHISHCTHTNTHTHTHTHKIMQRVNFVERERFAAVPRN